MPKSVFEIGNKITLQLIKRGNVFSTKSVDKTTYNSSLMHVISDNELTIAVPIFSGALLPMTPNDLYFIRFYTKSGMYQGKCVVLGRGSEGNIVTVNIKMITGLERHQRREYYRLEFRTDISWAKLNESQEKLYIDLKNAVTDARKRIIKEQIKMEDIQFTRGLMMDISGGGMRFNSKEMMEKDDTLIMIPQISEITATIPYLMGKVVLCNRLESKDSKKTVYENKIKFVNISNEEREKIITYIFAMEREKMRSEQ